MKKKIILLLGFLLTIFLIPEKSLMAQDIREESQITRILTRDGNEFIGTILREDDELIIFLTEKFGEITIKKIDIQKREIIKESQLVKGKVWFDNPQATRYFFAPNGYGLKPGESYYQNVWLFFNQFSFGITENFSFSAGIIPLFLFAGAPTPVWLNPKLSVPVVKDKYNVGVGALVGTTIGEGGSFGILYGVNTFGNKDKNLTIGLGWGLSNGDVAKSPTITISGMIRTGPRGYFLTENYIINTGSDSFGMLSFGGRRIISRVGLDYGLIIPLVGFEGIFFGIPWLGFTIPMGKN
jgi:hypothetical protein